MREWTIRSVINSLPEPASLRLPTPSYTGSNPRGLFMGVSSMQQHMTDEGWQLALSFSAGGYELGGHDLPINETNARLLALRSKAGVIVLQDKREWDVDRGSFRDPLARFSELHYLRNNSDLFKLTILKDSHQNPPYHRASADEIHAHGWVVYYHPDIVAHLAPYVRREDLIRTYHSLDPWVVPEFTNLLRPGGALISGAVSTAYPLRRRLIRELKYLPVTDVLKHPGYHRNGCDTPSYLRVLSKYKVAICTCSKYGYLLRKIIEATACGCVVITDLPSDEVVPEIDGNLVRVHPTTTSREVGQLVKQAVDTYDAERQREYAAKAVAYFDYRAVGRRLVDSIEHLRLRYASASAICR